MDDRRFDALARGLAVANNRRQFLRGLLGIGGAAAATSLGHADAARRPTPTPKAVSCPGEQTWNGSRCLCPDDKVNCGPDCCVPGVSECCDNACCFGNCYDEELCCPTGTIYCEGQCREWGCCTDIDCPGSQSCNSETHTCLCIPDCEGRTCGDDGCGGVCGSCLGGQTCSEGACACMPGTILCDGQCRAWECCVNSDCPVDTVCDSETHTCVCAPDCEGKTCGDDGCDGNCGVCPEGQTCIDDNCACTSGFLCSDGTCRECCAAADCAVSYGGDAECWRCFSNTCGYYSGFCTDGVCGVSSPEVVGSCLECGVAGVESFDACDAAVPCCSGYTCDFRYGTQGVCRRSA